jgi:hypothetical protein
VQDLIVGRLRAQPDGAPTRIWLRRDSLFWLVVVSVLFLAAELTPQLLRMPLGADEITYIAQTSARASSISLPPVHGQGAGLLAAPVTLLTTSLVALRIWMAVLSAIGLFLTVLCWRGLRPIWVLALGELILASLAISQNSGVQVYPDWWGALATVALIGLFLHAVNGTMPGRVVLPLIALASLVIALMRPQNVVFLMGPVILAVLTVRKWRKIKVMAAMAVGIALGFLDWMLGAYLWFGGLFERIRLAGQEPPSLHLYNALGLQLRYLNGPWYCSEDCNTWAVPLETPFWIGLLLLAALGVWVGWRAGMRASTVLAAATALWVFLLYAFLVPFGAPRYLLPTLALMSLLAADGIVWAVTKSRWRQEAAILAILFLVLGIVSQRAIVQRQAAYQNISRQFQRQATEIEKMGVHPPCIMLNPSIAWYIGCSAPWTTTGTNYQIIHQFVEQHTANPSGWKLFHLTGKVSPPAIPPPLVYLPASSPLIKAQS